MSINFHLPIMKRKEFMNPNFFEGGFTTKSVRMSGAQIPNTRENTLALALRSAVELRRLPELSVGWVAITIGSNCPLSPALSASAIKIYSSPR